jgi:hypothetical protein
MVLVVESGPLCLPQHLLLTIFILRIEIQILYNKKQMLDDFPLDVEKEQEVLVSVKSSTKAT